MRKASSRASPEGAFCAKAALLPSKLATAKVSAVALRFMFNDFEGVFLMCWVVMLKTEGVGVGGLKECLKQQDRA